jgi:phosphatidylglycerol:prolipoprotein diacylglycerol transferase
MIIESVMGLQLAGYWVHDLDPFAVRFPEGFPLPGIRWYGLAYLVGFVAAWWLLRLLARRGRLGRVHPEEVGDLVFWAAVGAVVGGRLGYAILYNFTLTVRQPWTIFQVWQGGMASHGGILGVTVALVAWWSRHKEGRFDATATENGGSASSRAGEPDRKDSRKQKKMKSKKQRKSAGVKAARGTRKEEAERVAWWRRWAATLRSPGAWRLGDGVVSVAPIGLFFGRVANFINGELWGRPTEVPWAVVFPESRAPLVPRHPSALYEAALEGVLLFVVLFPAVYRGWFKPGRGVVTFVLGYAVVRVFVEFFREPDPGIGYQWLHLTRGQWLSFVMAGIGVAVWCWVVRAVNKERSGNQGSAEAGG